MKQGDPTSGILFNIIIDVLLASLKEEHGVEIGREEIPIRVAGMGFADDTVLIAECPELRDLKRRLQKDLTITAHARPTLDRHGLAYQLVRRRKPPKLPATDAKWVAGGTVLEEKERRSKEVEQDGAKEASRGMEGPVPAEGRVAKEIGNMCDPSMMYASLNNIYLRQRIEEPRNLSLALTYIARYHATGGNICWPYPEAESRLRLRVDGLPS